MITAIVLAAGRGERAGFHTNKVFQELAGIPVLAYSLSAFSCCDEIIVVCRKEEEAAVKKILSPYPNTRTTEGGATRAESVYSGLKAARGDIVLIHDAARPYVSAEIIERCIESVKRSGSGIAAIPAVDTAVLSSDGGKIAAYLPRREVYAIQTPQAFYKDRILHAYARAFEENRAEEFTDDGGVYAAYVEAPILVEGGRFNRKLTYGEDFSVTERVGFGVDTHRFETQEDKALPFIGFIVLGGVKIPSDKRIVAHSDGDVLLHALMDALLSAAGLRDIGYYFPDTDEKYRGADSMELLAKVVSLIGEKGFAVQNASLSVLAEKPRLSPYIENMKKNVASALTLPTGAVGIAAGTNEKLGYIGEGKGITCYAYVALKKAK